MTLDIDPKVDYAFKHLFGRESTRPLLIDLLNQVLSPPPGQQIQEVELLNPFNPKETAEDKLSILDVKARDQMGRRFNVEMQMLANAYFKNRVVYYLTKFHQQQMHEGDDYSVLRPTISIVFINQVLFLDSPRYHRRFGLIDVDDHVPYSEDLELRVLELPKFVKAVTELGNGLDIWLYFLRNAAKMDPEALPEVLSVPLFQRAVRELKMLSQTDIERERYEARRKGQLDLISGLKAARLEGIAEGVAEGRAEGRVFGEKIGAIHAYERLLNRPETSAEELIGLSLAELDKLAADLQDQLRKRQ